MVDGSVVFIQQLLDTLHIPVPGKLQNIQQIRTGHLEFKFNPKSPTPFIMQGEGAVTPPPLRRGVQAMTFFLETLFL